MKCANCGAELTDDSKFCSYCGNKVEVDIPQESKQEIPDSPYEEPVKTNPVSSTAPKSVKDKIKEKGRAFWRKLSLYGKITAVSFAVFVIFLLVALLADKTAAIVIAAVQIVLLLVSLFMHKGIIKLEQKKLWLKWLVLVIAILFTALNVMSYSWGTTAPTTNKNPAANSKAEIEKIDWKNITLSNVLPEPHSNRMSNLFNGDDWLSVTIHDISKNQFLEYVRWCKEDYGFTVDSDSFDGYFYAFNQDGCCITLFYNETAKELDLNLDAPSDFDASTPISKTAIVPCGAAECLGKNYESLVDQFKKAGFQKVSAEANGDLGLDDMAQKGQVYEITIDGSATFAVGDEIDKNAVVKILYHDAKEIAAPISSEDAVGKDLTELIKLFEDAGFVNFATETKEDIDPEYSQDAFRNEISIGGDDSFAVSDTFPIDAEVKIVTHIPYEKYKVTLHINFIPNLLFNKYGVDVSRGYTELGTLSHGEDGDFEMWLKPGKYTFTFTKVSYIKPTKEITIDVKGETEIFYDLSCYEDSIHIEKTAHIDQGAIGENEAAVPAANSSFKYKNYKDVEAQLKEAGFNNISTLVLYDIVFGWTDEGEVDSVKINGKTDYILGDVFAKDTPIVITYHMPEEDDPSRIPMPDSSTSYVGKDYKEVEKAFKDLGFTNIVVESSTTSDTSYTDGEVYSVKADYESFEKGNTYATDDKITIRYYIVEEVVEDDPVVETPVVVENITIENNSEFAALMKITNQTDAATIRAFVNSHIGDVVEFDGCVVLMMHHEDYKTRFDVCMAGVDYDADRVYGPLFAFEDVAFYNMNVSGTDTVAEGMNFRIAGEIKGYSAAGGYILLKPVSMKAR